MAQRYISASERATALAAGVALFANVQHLPQGDVPSSQQQKAWLEWSRQWGEEMTDEARRFQFEMMTAAINFDVRQRGKQ